MQKFSGSYEQNVKSISDSLRVQQSFDVLCKTLKIGGGELTMFFIDGFTKDTTTQQLMMHFVTVGEVSLSAKEYMQRHVPYIEGDVTDDAQNGIRAVLSGCTLILGSSFGGEAIILDTRTYPARQTEEPEGDRVMRGSRDGFVETLIFNTALIRRRIRNPELTMKYFSIGRDSKTDVVLCYMNDRADLGYVKSLESKLSGINVSALTMGHESLKECQPMLETRMDAAMEHQEVVRPTMPYIKDPRYNNTPITSKDEWWLRLVEWSSKQNVSHSMNMLFTNADLLVKHLNMNKTELRTATGITTTALAKLGRNEHVNTEVLVKICKTLECNIEDIMEIVDEEV